MNSNAEQEKPQSFFESRLMSILLMVCLVIMCALFVVVVWTLFGQVPAINVIKFLSIGIGGGIVVTLVILVITITRKAKLGRNILLYLVGGILVISLVVALILRYTIADPDLSSWAFIDASSVGLGLTSGIALTYLILAMFKTPLTYGKTKEEKPVVENSNNENES
jgi:MFS family permease